MKPARLTVLVRLLSLLILALATSSLWAGDDPPHILLDAHFDDHAVDQPIGTGGAEAGEPVTMDLLLDAIVRQDADDPDNHLLALSTTASSSRPIRFEFLEQTEISHGRLLVSVRITFPDADFGQAVLYLREQGTAAKQFLSMNLQNTGTIRINDAAGLALVIPNAIPFGQSMLIEVIHDLDWRSYDLLIDGVAMLSNRSHGITDRGIGAVIFALQHQAEFDETRVLIDDLLVARWLPDMIFAHGFEGPR